jgi:hypothetical protein
MHRLFSRRNSQTTGNLRYPYDRRSGTDRRLSSYVARIPERRRRRDRRVSDERRKDWIRVSPWSSVFGDLYPHDRDLAAREF